MAAIGYQNNHGNTLAFSLDNMETNTNPFKELEPDAHCPPELKQEIFAELDMVRNALQVVEVYAYDLFTVLTVFLDGLMPVDRDNINPRS